MWERLISRMQNYFNVGRRDAIGFFIVLVCMFCLLLLPNAYDWYARRYLLTPSFNQATIDSLETDFALLERSREEQKQQDNQNKQYAGFTEKTQRYRLFAFNPNTATKEDFKQLGLSERVANNIIRYRGTNTDVFDTKEKLKKIWGLSEGKYNELAPYIQLPTKAMNPIDSRQVAIASETLETPKAPFTFNPNQTSFADLQNLGFPDSIAGRIIGYRNKVDTFRVKEDLLKIYDMPEELFQELYAYIDLPEANIPTDDAVNSDTSKKKSLPEIADSEPIAININQADAEGLMAIKGIGKAFSSRIIEFREKVGGFHTPRQLRDVYGLKEDTYQALVSALDKDSFSKENLRKINVYQADLETLKAHPYINYELADFIYIKSKRKKGITFNDLKDVDGINLYKLELLEPYLSFERTDQ